MLSVSNGENTNQSQFVHKPEIQVAQGPELISQFGQLACCVHLAKKDVRFLHPKMWDLFSTWNLAMSGLIKWENCEEMSNHTLLQFVLSGSKMASKPTVFAFHSHLFIPEHLLFDSLYSKASSCFWSGITWYFIGLVYGKFYRKPVILSSKYGCFLKMVQPILGLKQTFFGNVLVNVHRWHLQPLILLVTVLWQLQSIPGRDDMMRSVTLVVSNNQSIKV